MTAKKHTKKPVKPPAKSVAKPQVSTRMTHTRWRTGFAIVSLCILLGSSFLWALMGARVQQGNADQLVNSFLFQDWHTFQGALFPSAHTFLIKWPVFLVVQLLGASALTFEAITIALTLITVGGLAYILYRIERRPLEFGVLLLALASVFVLVPAQPYAGGLLPVNMAMIATRNIEYLLFIIAICIIVRWPQLKKPWFWLGVLVMGLLVASDKLFATMSVGGAVIAAAVYTATQHRRLLKLSLRYLATSVGAVIVSFLILAAINASGLTHISSQGSGPFAFVQHPKDLALGLIFGVLAIATNFGANPVFDSPTFKDMPHALHERLFSVSAPSFIINFALMCGAAWVMWRFVRRSMSAQQKSTRKIAVDRPFKVSILLIWSTLAAFAAFIITNHYYFVDARYVSIALFAAIISVATWLRTQHFSARVLYCVGAVLVCSVGLGLLSATHTYHAEQQALRPYDSRTQLISEALSHHPVNAIVGDYWRVLPLKSKQHNLKIVPLDSCTQARNILSSTAWQADLKHQSFAYILSFDKSLTNYPSCSLQQVLSMYGQPTFSVLISGKLDSPQESLLFFTPHDKPKVHAKPIAPPSSTVLPISLKQYPFTTCATGSTIMNVVAHQDDDLLFLSPDLLNSIQSGDCVRTVYITAGDAGSGQLYWLAREHGSEAAYNTMTKNTQPWIERNIKIDENQFYTIANPLNNPRYSLIFMHLPDGNVGGQGFRVSHGESLARLYGGYIRSIHSVDGQSSYTAFQLEAALQQMVDTFQPAQIRTQAPYNESAMAPDHSDHIAVGRMVTNTFEQFNDAAHSNIAYYVGYPVRTMPRNVEDSSLAGKVAAFLAYAQYDSATCQTMVECDSIVYGSYLRHQFTTTEFERQTSPY